MRPQVGHGCGCISPPGSFGPHGSKGSTGCSSAATVNHGVERLHHPLRQVITAKRARRLLLFASERLLSVSRRGGLVVAGVEQVTAPEQDPVDGPTSGAATGGDSTDPPNYRPRHARRRARWPWFVAGLVVIAMAAGTTTVLTRRDADHDGGRATLGGQAPPAGVAPAPNNEPGFSTDTSGGAGS